MPSLRNLIDSFLLHPDIIIDASAIEIALGDNCIRNLMSDIFTSTFKFRKTDKEFFRTDRTR